MEGQQTAYFNALYEVAKAVNSTLRVNEVLDAIVDGATKAIKAKGCSLMLLSPDRQQLWYSAAYGLSDRFMRKGPVSPDTSLAEALAGQPILVLDAATDPRVEYKKEVEQEGIASILCVPLKVKEDVIGAMNVYTSERREFSQDDINFLSAVADLGAIALENAMLYESATKDYDVVMHDLLKWYAAWASELTV